MKNLPLILLCLPMIGFGQNDNLYQKQKEEKNIVQENYKESFEIGALFGASFNNNTATADYEKDKHITIIEGLILKYNSNSNYTISLQINYHILGHTLLLEI